MSELPASFLSSNEQQAVASFVKELRQRHPGRIVQTILFGSKARGDSRPWSDIDILVIVDDAEWLFQHAISDLAARLSLEYDVLLGPRVIGRERWERMQEHRSGLYRNVVTEGIPLPLA